jgi:hypothetical protein
MFERMLDKSKKPSVDEIHAYIGKNATKYISRIQKQLKNFFDLRIELKFPFGDNYGWGYKVSHKTKHLFYLFFEKGSLTATIQIPGLKESENLINQLSKKGKQFWEKRYPCGNGGGWVHYRINNERDYIDFFVFLQMKIKKKLEIRTDRKVTGGK